jgi:preprotein translocase subunit SecA
MSSKTSTKRKNKSVNKSTPKANNTLIETVATPEVDILNESNTVVGGEPKMTKEQKELNKRSLTSKVLSRLVGEGKELSRYDKTVAKILNLEDKYKAMSDSELKAETERFRAKFVGVTDIKIKEKILNDILPEAFATVREGAYRAIGLKHFPVQLIGGMVLHEGRIAEMRTGEGKTLVSTLSGYLNALPPQNQVHLVTVNDYLARRDASWMGQIYNFLGLSIGVIQNQASFYFKFGAESSEINDKKRSAGMLETFEDGVKEDSRTVLDVEHLVHCDRKRAYWDDELDRPVDIVYGVNSEFGFDYLRDNMASTPQEVSQKAGHKVAIVDEVDSILIDEARTPLIISSQDADSSARYKQFSSIVKRLRRDIDYEVDEKRKIVTLTELGIEKVEREIGSPNLYGSPENVVLIHHLDQALRAEALFTKDKEYVVRDGEIVIVDENTGRMMIGRRYNQGLHQAIEAKEDVQVQSESKTTASITFQNYFRLYEKLSGMTGTAATESEEFFKIYKLIVVTIPTNRPISRIDKVDNIYKTEKGKFEAIAMDVQAMHKTGQPVLIGTTSIEKNLLLSEFLKKIRCTSSDPKRQKPRTRS